MSLPKTVDEVIARMRRIAAELSADDGVAVFNRMYPTVTERIAAIITRPGACRTAFPRLADDIHADYEAVNDVPARLVRSG